MDCQQFISTKNIFDCMAVAYQYIDGGNRQKVHRIQRRFKPDLCTRFLTIMREYTAQPGNWFIYFPALRRDICQYMENLPDHDLACYALIEAIDQFIDHGKCTRQVYFKSTRNLPSLTESVPGVIILPRNKESYIVNMDQNLKALEGSLGKREYGFRPRHQLVGEINSFLQNYYIYPADSCPHAVELVQFDRDHLFGDVAHMRDHLRFGVFPLISQDKDHLFDREETQRTFAIKNIQPQYEANILDKCQTALTVCIKAGVDIAIFPELMLNDPIVEKLIKWIKQNDPNLLPKLMILGSIWQNKANRSITVSNIGDIVLEHYKQTPYSYGTLMEDLSLENKNIQFLDYPVIGRIFSFICCDINNEDMLRVVERYGGDLMLLPSFSPSLNLKTKTEDLAKSYVCSTVMCNSCSALHMDRKEWTDCADRSVGFISIPAKEETNNACKIVKYKTGSNCRYCQQDSCGWLISLNLAQFDQGARNTFSNQIEIVDLD